MTVLEAWWAAIRTEGSWLHSCPARYAVLSAFAIKDTVLELFCPFLSLTDTALVTWVRVCDAWDARLICFALNAKHWLTSWEWCWGHMPSRCWRLPIRKSVCGENSSSLSDFRSVLSVALLMWWQMLIYCRLIKSWGEGTCNQGFLFLRNLQSCASHQNIIFLSHQNEFILRFCVLVLVMV